jgi:hypothetical protein
MNHLKYLKIKYIYKLWIASIQKIIFNIKLKKILK